MRNRGAYIYKLIYTTSIVLFLFSLFIRTIDIKTKIRKKYMFNVG